MMLWERRHALRLVTDCKERCHRNERWTTDGNFDIIHGEKLAEHRPYGGSSVARQTRLFPLTTGVFSFSEPCHHPTLLERRQHRLCPGLLFLGIPHQPTQRIREPNKGI